MPANCAADVLAVFVPVTVKIPSILIVLLVFEAAVSTLLLVPIRMLCDPVVRVVDPTDQPIATLLAPVVIDAPA